MNEFQENQKKSWPDDLKDYKAKLILPDSTKAENRPEPEVLGIRVRSRDPMDRASPAVTHQIVPALTIEKVVHHSETHGVISIEDQRHGACAQHGAGDEYCGGHAPEDQQQGPVELASHHLVPARGREGHP